MSFTLTWHGHANFQIRTAGCSILIDPFFGGAAAPASVLRGEARPDLVLVTHDHADHLGETVAVCTQSGAALAGVVGLVEGLCAQGVPERQILNGGGFNIGGTVKFKGVAVTMTEAFHTSASGAPVGFIIRLEDGYTIYHAGDTGIFANMAVWGDLFAIDLALLPTGGFYTMDGRQAALAASMLKCKAAVPMHWGTFPVLAQDTLEFEKELSIRVPACRILKMRPGQSLELSA
ncbi:MAG: metal-dependent hydrolase [Desulfovibrio sp.]|jgi:L-ascorbate metabolism protein UlaG (beta-lactamase superfamily)|nr:metal-dependent hydrolase [Desulfovibrio sp.]